MRGGVRRAESTRHAGRSARSGAARPGAPAVLAVGYGAYLLYAYATGALYYYIHPIYIAPAAATGALLLGLGLLAWRAGHAGHERAASRVAVALLALPLAVGALLPPRPLGVVTAMQRGLDAAPVGRADDLPEFRLDVDPASYTIKDWVKALKADPEPSAQAGKPVRVTGFVVQDAQMPAGTFMVARFVVQCCAVDAQPVGLLVRAPEAAALEPGAWVTVEGTFEVAEAGGRRRAVVAATAVTPSARPDQPYLY